jgi:hypothetical protein
MLLATTVVAAYITDTVQQRLLWFEMINHAIGRILHNIAQE